MIVEFPLLCKPEDAAGMAAARELVKASQPLAHLILSMPATAERDLAMQRLSEGVLWAHQAICRAGEPPRLVITRQKPL